MAIDPYALIVIGSGPAGEKAAVKAAYFGHRVALIEKAPLYGGAGVVTGTLPSKTLKETAIFLSGKYDKGLFGVDRSLDRSAEIETFMYRKNYIIREESEAVYCNLLKHSIDIYHGIASFKDAHTLYVKGEETIELRGEFILIATGSYPFHPSSIPFDGKRIHDSDSILDISTFPNSIAVLGAGVIGCEYATIFATMGSKVFLINRNPEILSFIDQDIASEFQTQMRHDDIDLFLGRNVTAIDRPSQEHLPLQVHLDDGEILSSDMFLFAAGRCGATKSLHLERVGLSPTSRELIEVNAQYQTAVPNIYAVGDVIGFPALASTSMDQGRVAVCHMFDTRDLEQLSPVLPYGIYTIPEISSAGFTEQEARAKGIHYGIGSARYSDLPRGKIMGSQVGLLKLIFRQDDLIVLGVHIMGLMATELIHHGMTLIENRNTLLDVIGKVYNFPTFHDLYKYAAYDGLSNVAGRKFKN